MDTIVLLMFMFAIFGVVGYVVMIYNGLIALKNDIDKAWANIDVMLKQRHDELPKLLDVCKALRVVAFEDGFQQAADGSAPRFVQRIAAVRAANAGETVDKPARYTLP